MLTMKTLKNFPACGYMAVRTTREMDFGPNSEPRIQPEGWDMLLFNETLSGRPGLHIAPATATDGFSDGEIYVNANILEKSDVDVTAWPVFQHYMANCTERAESLQSRLRVLDAELRNLFAEARKLKNHPGTQHSVKASLAIEGIRRYESMCTKFGPNSPLT